MSDESQRNSIFNVIADLKVHHATLDDLKLHAPEVIQIISNGKIDRLIVLVAIEI